MLACGARVGVGVCGTEDDADTRGGPGQYHPVTVEERAYEHEEASGVGGRHRLGIGRRARLLSFVLYPAPAGAEHLDWRPCHTRP